jgi:hypothetical protein
VVKSKETEPEEVPVYVAVSSGVVKVNGKKREYSRGLTVVRAGDPILKAVPTRFRPLMESRHLAVPERA